MGWRGIRSTRAAGAAEELEAYLPGTRQTPGDPERRAGQDRPRPSCHERSEESAPASWTDRVRRVPGHQRAGVYSVRIQLGTWEGLDVFRPRGRERSREGIAPR